jgi:hypothetical protein
VYATLLGVVCKFVSVIQECAGRRMCAAEQLFAGCSEPTVQDALCMHAGSRLPQLMHAVLCSIVIQSTHAIMP